MAVRLTPEDDEVIRRAASAKGMSVSAFVVTHTRAAAEGVLADRVNFFLDPEEWDELQHRLSQAPRHKPGLASSSASQTSSIEPGRPHCNGQAAGSIAPRRSAATGFRGTGRRGQ